MKQHRIVVALLLSLVISGGCTYLLARKMKLGMAPAPVADLLYAAPSHTLQTGEILKLSSLEVVSWPGNKPLRTAFQKPSDLVGRAVLYPMEAGQPILDRDVSAVGAGAGLAGKIPEGMRALALRSDEVAGVAGFLTPGSHVDVLVTYRAASSGDPQTATVLQNAQVIAVGQRAQPDPEGKPAPTTTVVTLLLSPEESERAVLASTLGMVHFVLRNGADTEQPKNEPMLLSMLSGAAPPAPPASIPRIARPLYHAAPTAPAGIETVLGTDNANKQAGSGQP